MDALNIFPLIQSIDSLELAQELDKKLQVKNKKLSILLQINSAYEDSKSGVMPEVAVEIYKKILEAKVLGKKLLTMLIDPDTKDLENIYKTIDNAISAHVDCFFIGGSLLHQNSLAEIVDYIKSKTHIPVILFPGNTAQVYSQADATLFPSVISGRNPELLIGRHVESAGLLRESGIEVISLGYMLIDSGLTTTVNYITNTSPIPYDNTNIAISTAIAGELLGMKMIYLEAGSGAPR